MLVMVGAIGAHAVLRRLIARRAAPLFTPVFESRPKAPAVDGRTLLGAAVFGVGWGLGGYCPGPSFVAAGSASVRALVFVAAMSAGMLVYRLVHQRGEAAAAAVPDCNARPT
jgi:uncharacterized membrane protein YedE/YeeE